MDPAWFIVLHCSIACQPGPARHPAGVTRVPPTTTWPHNPARHLAHHVCHSQLLCAEVCPGAVLTPLTLSCCLLLRWCVPRRRSHAACQLLRWGVPRRLSHTIRSVMLYVVALGVPRRLAPALWFAPAPCVPWLRSRWGSPRRCFRCCGIMQDVVIDFWHQRS